jgi:non-specific serine/threonine protein kinase
MEGHADRLEQHAEEALALCRAAGSPLLTPYALRTLMGVANLRGDSARARLFGEECLARFREIEDPNGLMATLVDLLMLARRQSDLEAAETRGRESLPVLRRLGVSRYTASTLEVMAWTAQIRGQSERAAVLLGAASALRASTGVTQEALERSSYEQTLADARAAAGEARFAAAWTRGQALSLEAAIAEALTEAHEVARTASNETVTVGPADGRTRARTLPAYPDRLSAREVEVLQLLATGHSNREIAATLVLSVRTIEHHLVRIYPKLGVRGRADAAAYAVRHGLLRAEASTP